MSGIDNLCDEIEPGLFLGSLDSATDNSCLEKHRITHVVTAFIFPVVKSETIKTMFVDVEDSEEDNILDFFDETYRFVEEGQREGACLVHCFAGRSRSAAIVIAYLMKKYGISFNDAKKRVKRKRYLICPNEGFEKQLQMYEEMGCVLDQENINYRLFKLEHLAKQVNASKNFDIAKSYANSREGVVRGDLFKCRSCRKHLFSEANLFRHDQITKQQPSAECEATYFVDILPWMDLAFKLSFGKINCKHCQSKLGSFTWVTGSFCAACTATMMPCFRIVSSSVDRERTVSS